MFRAQTTFLNETKVAFLNSEKQPFAFVVLRTEDVNFGDIYQGRILKKRPELHAFFVDIGKENPVFLASDTCLNEGAFVKVQVIKEPRPGKEAQVSLLNVDKAAPIGLIEKGALMTKAQAALPEIPWDETDDEALANALEPVVLFADGARLIIERTAAFWSIDVDSAASSLPFSEINNLATSQIVREIIKRNLNGNILVDFIGRKTVETVRPLLTRMKKEFADDPVPTQILGLSRLGHVEIRRRRQRSVLIDVLSSLNADAYRLFHNILAHPSPFLTIKATPRLYRQITGPLQATWQTVERKKGAPLTLKADPAETSFTIMENTHD